MLEVFPLSFHFNPFELWSSERVAPDWWNIYNEIKHGETNKKNHHNLKNALSALSALYLMHYVNEYSKNYISKFITKGIRTRGFKTLEAFEEGYTTPIDTKQYLFKIANTSTCNEYILPEEKERMKIFSDISKV